MKHTRVVSKGTPGFACCAFNDTILVCFIVNEHTTKYSCYGITSDQTTNQTNAKFMGYNVLRVTDDIADLQGHWVNFTSEQ